MLPNQDLHTLLINVGVKEYALLLDEVRHLSPLPTDFQYSGRDVAEFYVFEKTPLSYFSLWDILKHTSAYEEYLQLQALFPQRRQDHLDWMSALHVSILQGVPFTRARNPYECAFGQWYYSYHPQDRRLEILLAMFESPHARIHGLANQLLELSDHGHKERAIALFTEARDTVLEELLGLFDRGYQIAQDLQRRIAVIVDWECQSYALGVDRVTDIVTVSADRITRNPGHLAGVPTKIRSLLILGENRVVPVLEWRDLIQISRPPM